jgi:hypothetical protein
MQALEAILSNVTIGVLFVGALGLGVRGMFRAARGDKYSPRHRR